MVYIGIPWTVLPIPRGTVGYDGHVGLRCGMCAAHHSGRSAMDGPSCPTWYSRISGRL